MSETRTIPLETTHTTDEPPPRGGARWIWPAAWPVTAVFVLSNAATPLYVLWQRDLGFSRGTLTVIFAFYIVGLLGSLLVSGVLSDRVGRKPVLLPAIALAIVACVVFATAANVLALIAARLLTGIAVGAVVSAGMAAVTDVAGPERRRLAALAASSAMVFGAGLGPFLAGILSETLPAPTVTVFVVEIVLLATAFLVTLRMPVPRPGPAPTTGPGSTTSPVSTDGPASTNGSAPKAGSAPTNSSASTNVSAPTNGSTPVNSPASSRNADPEDGDRDGAPGSGGWIRVPRVPKGGVLRLVLGIAVFAPGITATSFVLSLGPSLLSGLLDTRNRAVAGSMAFVMFAAATGVQFAVQRLRRPTILLAGAVSTTAAMGSLVLAVHTSSVPALVTAAVLAGAGQGMGQLGGLSLLNSGVPARRLAEANAALNIGGYVPAGALPVAAGYLSDATGLTTGATVFGAVLAGLAFTGGTVVLATRRRITEGRPA
ncbi:MFS transporter [Actinomadura roseirufa]|uniref:MFS transporter n=1 Tax=Actinomadura roseirufa TaxID=2094049 RepID=UPI001041AB5F|nr:MFS transporter [Actinomadura roseirufa]